MWYDCGNPALASNETLGTWTSVTDFSMVGTSFCGSGQAKTGFVQAAQTATLTGSASASFDFSGALLFPNAPIVSASANVVGGGGTCLANVDAPAGLGVTLQTKSCAQGAVATVAVDQSAYSTTSKQG